jgi:glycosyltransferase involved in cell wall biosynthesis
MYTPLRYAWRSAALEQTFSRSKAVLVSLWMHYLRLWDLAAAARVDHFVAISHWVAACIRRAYRRSAEVIFPPVDVDDFRWDQPREEHYIAVTRLARHKRVSLIVDAFSRLGYPIYIVGDGPEHDDLAERAAPNVRLLRHQPRSRVAELLGRARGFIHAAEEDFGITMVEAQAAGCPVIAYGRGASRETVVDGKTGFFFPEQNVESVMTAVRAFEEGNVRLDPGELRRNAERFRKERFQRELEAVVEREWSKFKRTTSR